MNRQTNQRQSLHEREDLTGEHGIGDAGQMIFAVLFSFIWGLDTFFFHKTTFLNATISPFIRFPLAIMALAVAGFLAFTGLRIVFGETREEPHVITKSVFGLVRHPIYLGEILLYFGLLAFSLSLAAAGVWVAAMVFLHLISRHEERLLLDRFGQAYEAYMQEVPMWLPRIKLSGKNNP